MSNPSDKDAKNGVSRRSFMQRAGAGAAAVATVGVTGVPAFANKGAKGRVTPGATQNTPRTSPRQGYVSVEDYWGPNHRVNPNVPTTRVFAKPSGLPAILRWNRIAIDASGLDHTPVPAGDPRVFGEQIGPCRSARAIGLVHVAMFEAINAIVNKYESLAHMIAASKKTNRPAAVAQAAHDTLAVLFPSQKAAFATALAQDLDAIPNSPKKEAGILLGHTAALVTLGLCYHDGSDHPEPVVGVDYQLIDEPGHWRVDPLNPLKTVALGAQWNKVRPLMMTSASQFRLPPPPALDSAEYAEAFNEVKRLGGDGVDTPTERTEDQTLAGIYWAYDGTPSLCAPPRLYNQMAVQLLTDAEFNDIDMARGLALINLGLAEAGIASWDSKFTHDFWRPVSGIREADSDGNAATVRDTTFHPLGAPASNSLGVDNFTPPFPAYPSGHATFGGTLFQMLRKLLGTDDVAFTFTSDELNGETPGNDGEVRPLLPRTFQNFSQAEEENGQSRIYLGIHWAFDKTGGITMGRQVADYVFDHAFQPK